MGLFDLTVPQRPPGRRVEDRDCDQGGVAFSPPRCSHHTGRQEGSTAERTRSKEERLSGTRSAGCHVPEPHVLEFWSGTVFLPPRSASAHIHPCHRERPSLTHEPTLVDLDLTFW